MKHTRAMGTYQQLKTRKDKMIKTTTFSGSAVNLSRAVRTPSVSRRVPLRTQASLETVGEVAQQSALFLGLFPFDTAWNPNVDAQSIAPQLFASSLFPYLGFLYHLTKSGKTPKLTLIGFYFLLAFVAATIPAGIYAKKVYGLALANVDWLHGTAESLLTVTNLLIVLGLRQAIREAEAQNAKAKAATEAGQSGDGAGPAGASAAKAKAAVGSGADAGSGGERGQ